MTAPDVELPATPARTPTAKDRVEFGLYRLLSGGLLALPEGAAIRVGEALGWTAGSLLRIRRRVVEENLARAFPDRPESWRRWVAAACYRHYGRESVETFRLARETRERLLARTEVHGIDALLEAVRGPGALIATGHLGNWEVAGGALTVRGAPIDGIAVRQRNPLFDRALVENRARLGIRVVYRGVSGRDVLRSLREGRVPVLLADQDAGGGGVFVDFLGSPASTTRGPALLALRSGALLFGGACLAHGREPRRWSVHLEPLSAPRTGDLERDVRALTQAHADFLAGFVRLAPEQYFWPHKRWKTRPDPHEQERDPLQAV